MCTSFKLAIKRHTSYRTKIVFIFYIDIKFIRIGAIVIEDYIYFFIALNIYSSY
ncbi:hypothetical protein GCM10008908_30270 [Clostridium subterminale]|uniref:Uncharacterized protein n=1 Tax=Clostridium subterminale TaxID=1550 RepID=A0ABN1KVG5_CLOSU